VQMEVPREIGGCSDEGHIQKASDNREAR
jgi:hypothetical protein